MSSMSFIEQSQQIQRSQRTQSPTANILQAGSDCGCNSSGHSLIAQSQKVGCGCNEGTTNTYDRTNEDSNPPVPVFQTADGCYMVFDHMERVIVPDNPLEDKPDYWRPVYRRECPKDGGTNDGGGGVGGGKGGGAGVDTPPFDPFDIGEPTDRRICVTCRFIIQLYDKLIEALSQGHAYPVLTGVEQMLSDAIYGLLREAFKSAIERGMNGDRDPELRNPIGDSDPLILDEMDALSRTLKLQGNVMDPAKNIMSERSLMFNYIVEYLNLLRKCPSAVFIKLQRFPSVGFKFETVHLENKSIYDLEEPYEVKEFTSNGETRQFYNSHYAMIQNPSYAAACPGGYSIANWEKRLYDHYNWNKLHSDLIL